MNRYLHMAAMALYRPALYLPALSLTALSLTALFLSGALSGCELEADVTCRVSDDCHPLDYCRAGVCVSRGAVRIEDDLPGDGPGPVPGERDHREQRQGGDDVGGGTDRGDDSPPPDATSPALTCPGAHAPAARTLVLNEFMVNVPSGPGGDANGDGVRHAHDDEFLELVNTSATPLDLTGVRIYNGDTLKFMFPAHCLQPLHAVVVFGGLEPGAALPVGPGYTAFRSASRFSFNNDRGTVRVLGHGGDVLAHVDYERAPAQALTLDPQLEGEAYVAHTSLAGADDTPRPFSPGVCSDGRPFTTRCAPLPAPDDEPGDGHGDEPPDAGIGDDAGG